MSSTPLRVRSADGVELAVFETGTHGRPTIVALHGYPDNHRVWDGVVDLLVDRYRVITYDVRGAGDSDQPRSRSAYRMSRLTDDFFAVLDAVSPDEPVHLLAHDWGSIQSWPALADARSTGRVASFTSISGPSLDHAAVWLRSARRRPRAVVRQLAGSYYIALFQLPVLPELLARRGTVGRLAEAMNRRASGSDAAPDVHRTTADAVNGIQLYRANMLPRLRRPGPERIDIPVQVLAPTSDPHVSQALQTEAPKPFVADLRVRTITGGHWIVAERPDVIAELVSAFVDDVAQSMSTDVDQAGSPG